VPNWATLLDWLAWYHRDHHVQRYKTPPLRAQPGNDASMDRHNIAAFLAMVDDLRSAPWGVVKGALEAQRPVLAKARAGWDT